MLIEILFASLLVAITVVMHTVGFSAVLRAILRSNILNASGFWRLIRFMTALTVSLILIHVAEVAVWGQFYLWQGLLPDAESAFYFSGVTYTTVGYGELVLARPWRILAPLEAITGILMCGLSTGLFFAIVNHWIRNWMKAKTTVREE